MAAGYLSLVLYALNVVVASSDPIVTLNHGGQLCGKSFDYNGKTMDIFLGIRYASAPTGSLRFQKPSPPKAWSGIEEAVKPGDFCPQLVFSLVPGSFQFIGNEDCLFMDVTVPGGVDLSVKKPVMVWIHGGGYTAGFKDAYLGASLAKHGDVIVATINYRLGALGFLYDGPGTGNFGLWDQRAALLWIQDNIAQFGGDPDCVTIFGESAGAGSVSAQLMGQHNTGLFQRAIQESGSLYAPWGWFSSGRQQHELVQGIKERNNCSATESVYKCLREMPVDQILTIVPLNILSSVFHPEPDNDFFGADVKDESYVRTQSFDSMIGFNKQEGSIAVFTPTINNQTQEPIHDGLSRSYIKLLFQERCTLLNPATPDACVDFFINTYELNSTDDDKERTIRASFAIGEIEFNSDSVRQLSVHSKSPRSTYAYEFSEDYKTSASLWQDAPDWSEISAGHGEEIPFVFGSIYNNENNVSYEYFDGGHVAAVGLDVNPFFNSVRATDKPLTDLMMTMWTNFATTGNPNKPIALPDDVPQWPEFTTDTNLFMEFNSTNTRVITTPHKDRLDKMLNTIYPARSSQIKADVVKGSDPLNNGDSKDAVVG